MFYYICIVSCITSLYYYNSSKACLHIEMLEMGEVRINRKLYVRDIEGRRRGRPSVPRPFTGDALPFQMFVKRFLTLSRGKVDLKPTAAKSGTSHLLHGGLSAADLFEEDQGMSSFAIDDHLIYRSELMELHVQVLFRHTI